MRIPKMKKDPKTINIRKLKSFDSVAFLEELKSNHFDAIKDITKKQMRCGPYGNPSFWTS